MDTPIHQKKMLSLKEGVVYFSLDLKKLRRIAEDHPELAVRNGGGWEFFREKMEEYISTAPNNEMGERML